MQTYKKLTIISGRRNQIPPSTFKIKVITEKLKTDENQKNTVCQVHKCDVDVFRTRAVARALFEGCISYIRVMPD